METSARQLASRDISPSRRRPRPIVEGQRTPSLTMTDNLHRYLDGDVPRGAIPISEQEALRETEEAIFAARSWIRSSPAPDLTSRVMAEVARHANIPEVTEAGPRSVDEVGRRDWGRQRRTQLAAALRWALTPRPFALRPAMVGLFAIIALLLVGRLATFGPTVAPADRRATASADQAAPVLIQFRLDAAEAAEVSLAGTFTEWQPAYDLRESAPGVWTVTVPLQPGVHDYLFIVDGERWVPDPVATPIADGFGGINSRLLLSAPIQDA